MVAHTCNDDALPTPDQANAVKAYINDEVINDEQFDSAIDIVDHEHSVTEDDVPIIAINGHVENIENRHRDQLKLEHHKPREFFMNGHKPHDVNHLDIENKYFTSDAGFTTSEEFADKSVNCCENKTLMIKTILAGQVLSFMLCGTGTAATALSSNYGVRAPSFSAFLMYTILASTFGVYAVTRKDFWKIFKKHWWKYLIVSILDVEGNFLLTKAYAYTTLTSVQLCDSFTIPTVMIISFIFLRIRYKIIHYVGVILCIGGAVSLVFLDGGDDHTNAPNEILGDVIALTAAVLYGTSNVGQEYLVKKYSSPRYLGIIGIYGFFISGIQTAAVEHKVLENIHWNWKIGLLFLAFAVAQYFYYSVMPLVMKLSSATVVNLSLLTSDLYTLMVGLFLFGYTVNIHVEDVKSFIYILHYQRFYVLPFCVFQFSYLYFIAFASILIGLITYNIKETPTAPKKPKKKKDKRKKKMNGATISEFKNKNGMLSKVNGHTPLLISDCNVNYSKL